MNGQYPIDNNSGEARNGELDPQQDPMLQAVLNDFRASVHAWSEATYQSRGEATYRSHSLVLSPVPRRSLFNHSLAWALSLALVAGVASTGAYEFHQRDLAHQAAVQREAEHQRQLALEQRAREVDELLAKVDSDLSREVPSAMEPLASLMADDNTQ